jgi:hypothetical protein
MQTVQINKRVFEVSFQAYVQAVIDRNRIQQKTLKPQQIMFLAYPFITSVFWAKQNGKRVTRQNIYLYYNTKQKQYALRLN